MLLATEPALYEYGSSGYFLVMKHSESATVTDVSSVNFSALILDAALDLG